MSKVTPHCSSATVPQLYYDDALCDDELEADSLLYLDNNERLKILFKKLNFRLVDCTLTFKDSHLAGGSSKSKHAKKRPSKITAFGNKMLCKIESLRTSITYLKPKTYNNCVFIPSNKKQQVKDLIQTSFPKIGLAFENCEFINRNSTLAEKIIRKLRNIFGIPFELEYVNGTVTITDFTFRTKDITFIKQQIQERIEKEG